MQLHELISEVCEVLRVKGGDLREYMLHTFDDNGGFLRTRYCYLGKELKDKKIGQGYKVVLVTAETPIEEAEVGTDVVLKMQLNYNTVYATENDAFFDVESGYCYVYLVDLENKTYSRVYKEMEY